MNPEFGQVMCHVIMDILYLFTCRPVNSPIVVRSNSSREEGIIRTCSPVDFSVNPDRQVERSTGGQERLTHNALHSYVYLSTC